MNAADDNADDKKKPKTPPTTPPVKGPGDIGRKDRPDGGKPPEPTPDAG